MTLDPAPAAEPRYTFDFARDDAPSSAVVEAVATTSDADPIDVDQLYDAVDPDALDALLADTPPESGGTRVEFEYGGYLVALEASGHGVLYDLDPTPDAGPPT